MNRKRSNRILISLNDKEFEHVNDLVKKSGYSRESYIRSLINKVVPSPKLSNEMNEILKQLRMIGSNINQIAFIANTTKNINHDSYMKHYEELQGVIFDIKKELCMPRKLEDD